MSVSERNRKQPMPRVPKKRMVASRPTGVICCGIFRICAGSPRRRSAEFRVLGVFEPFAVGAAGKSSRAVRTLEVRRRQLSLLPLTEKAGGL
eukprot:scaffold130528_cov29-Tisochrysis_lutea.AAC.1